MELQRERLMVSYFFINVLDFEKEFEAFKRFVSSGSTAKTHMQIG